MAPDPTSWTPLGVFRPQTARPRLYVHPLLQFLNTPLMASNRLLLNPSKSQAIWLGGRRQLAKIDIFRLSSLFPRIMFSTCVRDLGVMLDPELTFSNHISLVTRRLRVVSRSLTRHSILKLVHAFVTSRIDCCSSLLVRLPLGTLAQLDRFLR